MTIRRRVLPLADASKGVTNDLTLGSAQQFYFGFGKTVKARVWLFDSSLRHADRLRVLRDSVAD